jgi:predicted kinase
MPSHNKLIVLRGPSGSGKTTTAKSLCAKAQDKVALVEQDYFRRIVLREKDDVESDNASLISLNVQFALSRGYDVVLEGIFLTRKYREMFDEIFAAHTGNVYAYYFDISLDETLRRHATKSNAHEFGEAEMRKWYTSNDLLNCNGEQKITENLSLEDTVCKILVDSQLLVGTLR